MSRVIVTVGVATYHPAVPPGTAGTTVCEVTGAGVGGTVTSNETVLSPSALPALSSEAYLRTWVPVADVVTVGPEPGMEESSDHVVTDTPDPGAGSTAVSVMFAVPV